MSGAPILIGGSGRSGTTILLTLLTSHCRVHSIPMETRFVVDSDGIYDLFHNLTAGYSLVRGREALYRFERMMRHWLADPGTEPYAGHDLAALCGRAFYFERLERLLGALTAFSFEGHDHSVSQGEEPRLVAWARRLDARQKALRGGARRALPPVEPPRRQLRYARHFAEPAELLALLGAYVDDLFGAAARLAGKDTWCEKTPHNLLHAPFLLRLLPRSVFIHIVRDPRAIVRSLMQQPWAPRDADGCCRYVEEVYDCWNALRAADPPPPQRYLEVRLEDLTRAPQQMLATLARFAGLSDDFAPLPEIRPEHDADWRRGLPGAEAALIEKRMDRFARQYGYDG